MSISAIINLYKRKNTCVQIINALHEQTMRPEVIHIWANEFNTKCELPNRDQWDIPIVISQSEKNMGVWARFAYALNMETDEVVVFDDDTVPGNRWLENCKVSMNFHPALYGTVGLQLHSLSNYQSHKRIGWPAPDTKPRRVDLVGHSWYLKREWLSVMWNDLRPKGFDFVGEDMHLSFALQKYLNVSTWVPPHPPEQKEFWGSIDGFNKGTDRHSIWESNKEGARHKMDLYLQHLVSIGWKLPYAVD